ncbi:thiosulfate sulfurtransferase 16, chloroplastic [Coffea arabica]|nr:thiosulfate sulfurtransferase 16, chloroplastic-like [Coffea arabica]
MMGALSVSSSATLSTFLRNLPHHFRKSYASVSALSMAKAKFQLPKQRKFSTGHRNPSFSWMATVGENVQSNASAAAPPPTSVPVRVAHELLQAGHRYLDVRTAEEFSAGHAAGAVNVPYMFRVGSGMIKNLNFVEEVLAIFGKDDEIIVGCQLGKRSLMAATDLISAGFTGITDIAGGYAAWVQNELPTES